MNMDDVKRTIEDRVRLLQEWPDRDKDLAKQLPAEGLCALCWAMGRTPQPRHDLILLCPHPSALIVPFSWNDGRLIAGPRAMVDKTAMEDMVKVLAERYARQSTEYAQKWVRLHAAAAALLEACEVAVPALRGFGNEEEALRLLTAAISEAKGGEADDQG